jgi:hypothetical protein
MEDWPKEHRPSFPIKVIANCSFERSWDDKAKTVVWDGGCGLGSVQMEVLHGDWEGAVSTPESLHPSLTSGSALHSQGLICVKFLDGLLLGAGLSYALTGRCVRSST